MPWISEADAQRQLSAPMPWIGMYVAGASLICTVAMAADAFHGFRSKKYWFPSKYFSLNATSLTLLAVAMKLPMDLTTQMYTVTDRLSKVSSLALMSTAMANVVTSLGSMDDKDILMNVTALGILVITVAVNVCIQVVQMRSYLDGRLAFAEEILAIFSMLLLLVMFISSAVMLPSTKRYLETKYQEMHKSALDEEQGEMERITTDKLRLSVRKYWVMAETSSPQFVIARSITCTSSGVVSLLIVLTLVEAQIRMAQKFRVLHWSNSDYGWSTKWILLSQTIGVIVGTIAPASRWFIAIRFRSSNRCSSSIRSAFRVEGYWTQRMVEWKQSSLPLKIRHIKSRKVLHDMRRQILRFCIAVQSLIVLASKLVLLISVCIPSPIISCLNCIKKLTMRKRISDSSFSRHHDVPEPTADPKLDIGLYVMLLEGEAQLPAETLENICREVDKTIQRGKMQKPENLLKLLQRSCNFTGVIEFDSHQVPKLHSQELPYCWSLPIVTLTSIALALPNIDETKSKILLDGVTEGLLLVKRIDKILDKKGGLANIRKAADVVWVGVELYCKWQDKDLHETSRTGINSRKVLQELSSEAEMTVLEFVRDVKDCLMNNPINWPAKIIAANTMYRTSRTIMMACDGESEQTDERLFEQISVMIADILSACLTNLAHVITMKCHRNAIEEREKSVHQAALLLGETEEILALLQEREWPCLAPNQGACIDEWRAFIKLENKNNQDYISRPNIDRTTSIKRITCSQ